MHSYSRHKEPELAELESAYTEAVEEEHRAFEGAGRYSRDFVNAQFARRIAERKLSSARHREEQRARSAARTPKEIVDELMGP